MRVSELSNVVHGKYKRFKPKNYGYSQFTKFLQAIPELELYGDINARKVRIPEKKKSAVEKQDDAAERPESAVEKREDMCGEGDRDWKYETGNTIYL